MGSATIHEINTDKFSGMVREKRKNRGLREIAIEIGDVSISTLSRIEQGKVPDVDTFIKICKWLNISPETFINQNEQSFLKEENLTIPEKIAIQLRADQTLSKQTVDALIQMINLAYLANNKGLINQD